MDHLKAIEGLLAFHRGEVERFEIARLVLLEIERRMEDRIAEKRAARGKHAPKKLTYVKKANGQPGMTMPAVKDKIIELLSSESDLPVGEILRKLGMTETKQAKGRVYTTLNSLKKEGRITVNDNRQYRLAAA